MSQGVDITRYAWVNRGNGYDLREVGGPVIGFVRKHRDGFWDVWPGPGCLVHVDSFLTRREAGRWLVEQWEGKGNG